MFHVRFVFLVMSLSFCVLLGIAHCSCPKDCSSCQNDTCTKCNSGFYIESMYCKDCPSRCLACKYAPNCSDCLTEGNCSSKCNQTCTQQTCKNVSTDTTEDNICMHCNTRNQFCSECEDFWKCTSCYRHYTLKFIDENYFTCFECPENCINCTSSLSCSECTDGYQLSQIRNNTNKTECVIENSNQEMSFESTVTTSTVSLEIRDPDNSSVTIATVVGIVLALCLVIAAVVVLKCSKSRFAICRSMEMNEVTIAFSNRLHSLHFGNHGGYDDCKSGTIAIESDIGTAKNYETIYINGQESTMDSAVDNTNHEENFKTTGPEGGDQEVVHDDENGGVYDVCKAGSRTSNATEIGKTKMGGGVYGVCKTEKDGVYNICKAGTSVPAGPDIVHSDVYNKLEVTVQLESGDTDDGRDTSQEVARHSVKEADPVYAIPIKRSLRRKSEVHQDNVSTNTVTTTPQTEEEQQT